jgi:predicted kinase
MKKPKLIIIRGLPGSGKSTLAEKLALLTNYTHVEADQYFLENSNYVFQKELLPRAHSWCQDLARSAINNYSGAIVANTFTTYQEVKPYLKMVDSYDDLVLITLSNSFGSIHDVPEETMKRMSDRFLPHEVLDFQIQKHLSYENKNT